MNAEQSCLPLHLRFLPLLDITQQRWMKSQIEQE
jgi:hypothetical protein